MTGFRQQVDNYGTRSKIVHLLSEPQLDHGRTQGTEKTLPDVTKYEASENAKALVLIKKMSPAAWRHTHLNGHYTFRGDGQVIDLDAIEAGLELG